MEVPQRINKIARPARMACAGQRCGDHSARDKLGSNSILDKLCSISYFDSFELVHSIDTQTLLGAILNSKKV
jgi:hypothetical protein